MLQIDASACLGSHDVLLATIDTLRFDVAEAARQRGLTPNLNRLLPGGAWETPAQSGEFYLRRASGLFRRLPANAGCPARGRRSSA